MVGDPASDIWEVTVARLSIRDPVWEAWPARRGPPGATVRHTHVRVQMEGYNGGWGMVRPWDSWPVWSPVPRRAALRLEGITTRRQLAEGWCRSNVGLLRFGGLGPFQLP